MLVLTLGWAVAVVTAAVLGRLLFELVASGIAWAFGRWDTP